MEKKLLLSSSLRSTTFFCSVMVLSSPPPSFFPSRKFFSCWLKLPPQSFFRLLPSSAVRCCSAAPSRPAWHNSETAKLFNSTKPDVMADIMTEASVLPSHVDLKDLEKWKVVLFQFASCPFCRKVQVCLDHLKIPYSVVETHPLSKKELKTITDYRKVPVLAIYQVGQSGSDGTPDNQKLDRHNFPTYILKDSKRIVHTLMSHAGKQVTQKERKEIEIEWIKWTDDILVQLVVMNIYRTLKESAETFAYLLSHPDFSWFEKYSARISGTFVMWLVSRRRKSKYQVVDERQALYDALTEFIQAKNSNPFLGGESPNEADINVYGILKSIEGFSCDRDIKENTKIASWLTLMEKQTQKQTC